MSNMSNMSNTDPNPEHNVCIGGICPNPGADHNSVANPPGLPGDSVAGAGSIGPGVPSRSVVSSSPSLGATTISTVHTATGGLLPLPTVKVPAPSGGEALAVSQALQEEQDLRPR